MYYRCQQILILIDNSIAMTITIDLSKVGNCINANQNVTTSNCIETKLIYSITITITIMKTKPNRNPIILSLPHAPPPYNHLVIPL